MQFKTLVAGWSFTTGEQEKQSCYWSQLVRPRERNLLRSSEMGTMGTKFHQRDATGQLGGITLSSGRAVWHSRKKKIEEGHTLAKKFHCSKVQQMKSISNVAEFCHMMSLIVSSKQPRGEVATKHACHFMSLVNTSVEWQVGNSSL